MNRKHFHVMKKIFTTICEILYFQDIDWKEAFLSCESSAELSLLISELMKILCGELQVIAMNLHILGILSREAQFWLMAAEMNQESYWLAETLGNCTRERNSAIGKTAICHLGSLKKCKTSDMLIAHFDELDSILSDECGTYHIAWLDN